MTVVNFQLVIFFIIICGYLLAKKGIISKNTRKDLSNLLLYIILPCSIVKSFNMVLTIDIIKNTFVVFIISLLIQLSYSVINRFAYINISKEKTQILKYSTIVSNNGFMGLPIIESIYGSQGLLYGSIALIPVRIAMWSSGLSQFTKTTKKEMIKTIAFHPCVIAVYLGFGLMLLNSLGIELPSFIIDSLSSIGGCLTCLSMFIIGATLSEIDISNLLDLTCLYYSLLRLILIPLVVFGILLMFECNPLIISVNVLMAAMPAGPTVAMMAEKYNGNVEYASKIVVISTLFSFITLPLITLLMEVML